LTKIFFQKQFARFLIVGGASAIINYGTFAFLFLVVAVRYEAAFIFGFVAGAAFGYIFNRAWTFKIKSREHRWHIVAYFIMYLISLFIGLASIRLLVEGFDLTPPLANIVTVFVTTFTNYVGARFWVFRQ